MESLFIMGYPEYAMQRCRERYGDMVMDSRFSTLYEGWGLGQDVFGEGTVNQPGAEARLPSLRNI